jgi:hypothetical protein
VHVAIVTAKLDNDTTLSWEPAAGNEAARCEVVWRETSAPDWQFMQVIEPGNSQPPGKAITVTLPISKDNVIFGVRAVDTAGHRGLAVVP